MRWTIGLGLLAALAAAPCSAQKAPKDITALYDKLMASMNKKDMSLLLSTATKDFKMKEIDGKVYDAKAAEEVMKAQFAMPGKVKIAYKIDSCKVAGNKATVQSTMHMEQTTAGQGGKVQKMTGVNVSKDMLVKVGSEWKFNYIEAIKSEMFRNGKKIDPTMPPGGPAAGGKKPKK